jgi:hypothetical protein
MKRNQVGPYNHLSLDCHGDSSTINRVLFSLVDVTAAEALMNDDDFEDPEAGAPHSPSPLPSTPTHSLINRHN